MTGMARTGSALVFVLALAAPAFAQSKVGGGVLAGVNFATVSGTIDSDVSKSIRTGGAFGGFVSTTIKEGLTFEPGILYSMEGVKAKFTDNGTTFESTAKVNVVQIPLLFRWAMSSKGTTSAYVIAGPSFGIIASAKQTDPTGGSDVDFKDQLKKGDASLVVGAGATFASRYFAEGRFSAGLTNVNKDTTDGKNRSNVFSILFGARF